MRPRSTPHDTASDRSVVRSALVRFGVLTCLTLVAVATLTVWLSRHLADEEAIRDARVRTLGIAHGIAAPLLDGDLRRGDEAAMADLDSALRNRMRDGTVAHIVLWDLDGSVIWTDEPESVHPPGELPESLLASEVTDHVVVESEREDHPLTYTDAGSGSDSLVEVYVRTVDADGEPFVFEAYTPPGRLRSDSGAVLSELLPLTLGSLLVLALAIMPLALSLARRIDRTSLHRRDILRHSLRSWQRDRERLAQSLHDDVIQDLSAAGYALPAVLEALPATSRAGEARAIGEQITAVLVRSVGSLRSVLTDLVPSGFEDASLEQALLSVAEQHRGRGMRVELSTDPELRAGRASGTLVYRIVREGLQNAGKHAQATEVTVRVLRRDAVIEVTVEDDGRGVQRPAGQDDHVGLRLLEHFLADVGGSLDLIDRPGGGARLSAVVPAELPELEDALVD